MRHIFAIRDSLTNKRDLCPPPCAMYVPCCSIRAVSTAQATPDQHPEQTQIEQRPDFGNIAKRQTRPSPTQSTFSVDGALPGRRCAILAGSMHSPRLAGRGRSAVLGPSKGEAAETFARDASGSRPAQDAPVHARPGEFRPVWSGARPIMASRFLGCSQAPTDPLNAPSGRRRGGG